MRRQIQRLHTNCYDCYNRRGRNCSKSRLCCPRSISSGRCCCNNNNATVAVTTSGRRRTGSRSLRATIVNMIAILMIITIMTLIMMLCSNTMLPTASTINAVVGGVVVEAYTVRTLLQQPHQQYMGCYNHVQQRRLFSAPPCCDYFRSSSSRSGSGSGSSSRRYSSIAVQMQRRRRRKSDDHSFRWWGIDGDRYTTVTTTTDGSGDMKVMMIARSSTGSSSKAENTDVTEIGIGIDLGTTNSAVAYLLNGTIPTILSIPHNGRTIPSIVALEYHGSNSNENSSKSDTHHHFDDDDDDDSVVVTPIVGKLALIPRNNNNNHHRNDDGDNDLQHQNQNQRMIYRNVKRIIGTGGNIGGTKTKTKTSSLASSLSVSSFFRSVVVPHVQISNSGKTYTKQNLMNQLYDSIHHPTLLRSSRHRRRPSSWPTTEIHDASITTNGNDDHIHDDNDETTKRNEQRNDSFLLIRPEQISSYIIQTLKQETEQHFNHTVRVTRAVIGVPAYFNEAQRNATIVSAQLAGIDKVKLLREPEAAALAYGYQQQINDATSRYSNKDSNSMDDTTDELVLVFDLGGGTYDVSVLYVSSSSGSRRLDGNNDGIIEVIATSGNTELGGTTFDSKIAIHLQKQMQQHRNTNNGKQFVSSSYHATSKEIQNTIVLVAEAIRIYLSNRRIVHLLLPLNDIDWSLIAANPSSVIIVPNDDSTSKSESLMVSTNTTHLYMSLSRREMETICMDEIQALLRPLREVAIMAGAFLPGDSSPSTVAAVTAFMDDEDDEDDDEFYNQNLPKATTGTTSAITFEEFYSDQESNGNTDDDAKMQQLLLKMASSKKSQQQGRRRSRDVAKEERKYRQEKKNIAIRSTTANIVGRAATTTIKNPKVRDGISGRPLSRIVLVGGATRMPCIGRLLTTITGIVPQRTVNPDEAVALGCAVQVGIYDGQTNMGTVLTPIQAAILRATTTTATTGSLASFLVDDDDDFDEGEVC